jgi:hypothetical protein
MGCACSWVERDQKYNISVGKPEGKRPLGRPRRRWRILQWIREIGFAGVDWVHLAQDRDN